MKDKCFNLGMMMAKKDLDKNLLFLFSSSEVYCQVEQSVYYYF